MKDTWQVEFSPEGLRYEAYPFAPSVAARRALVRWTIVRDADPNATPPEVRLKSGETLFVTRTQKAELASTLARAGIPIVSRPDVWHWLLEPYLDTQFTPSDTEQTLARLESAGVSPKETDAIRAKVGRFMLAYNAIHWDWVHLGLDDLLVARHSLITRAWQRVRGQSFAEFYWWAMAIADRPTPRATGDQAAAAP